MNNIDCAVKWAFIKLDNTILDAGQAALLDADPCDATAMSVLAPAIAGSCVVLSIFDPETKTLRVASVGDSRAVLASHNRDMATGERNSNSSAYEPGALSEDQNAENKDEVSRIKAAHPGERGEELFN
ncbi:hypothetical protein LMH87_009254 [Akanthomyces muscarius]|uniref:PPM-type phosphatase domain-containing protein n=1 Tax=Akanthomyces muscarius TaxID=2231603 RepID=A0A9W8QBK1_AKAMU|nr:hypothetical protein LMH87_009254 [Akanthomyces muscarius]KAJ4152731.1 hypothetical protein LMH87_009254 [Akanthomyces muscarius]